MSNNFSGTNTQVILSKANYRVINSVSASETATLIMGIGPKNSQLLAKAKQNLMTQANLSGGGYKSRALINFTIDQHITYVWLYFPFYFAKTITVTADVIEFIPESG